MTSDPSGENVTLADGADLRAERRRLPPGGRVPKRDAPRAVASRDLLSVRREADREEQGLVPHLALEPAVDDVPDLDEPAEPGCGELASVV